VLTHTYILLCTEILSDHDGLHKGLIMILARLLLYEHLPDELYFIFRLGWVDFDVIRLRLNDE